MELPQGVWEVVNVGGPLPLPHQPGLEGEIQVGRESPQVADGVDHEELVGVATQNERHEVVLVCRTNWGLVEKSNLYS